MVISVEAEVQKKQNEHLIQKLNEISLKIRAISCQYIGCCSIHHSTLPILLDYTSQLTFFHINIFIDTQYNQIKTVVKG